MKPLIFLLFVTAFSTLAAAQDCLTNAKVPDHQVPESVRLEYSRNLEIAARNYYRPRDPKVAARHPKTFNLKVNLFTIDEVFGGWQKAQATHFNDGGVFDRIQGE